MCWEGDSWVDDSSELLPASKKEVRKHLDAQDAKIDDLSSKLEKTTVDDAVELSSLQATVKILSSLLVSLCCVLLIVPQQAAMELPNGPVTGVRM